MISDPAVRVCRTRIDQSEASSAPLRLTAFKDCIIFVDKLYYYCTGKVKDTLPDISGL